MNMKKNEYLTLSYIENKYLGGKDTHTPVSSAINPKTTNAPFIGSKSGSKSPEMKEQSDVEEQNNDLANRFAHASDDIALDGSAFLGL